MNLDGSAVLHADPERVWSVITDPAVLARTIPGCESLQQVGEDEYKMNVLVGVGAVRGTYAGEVRLSDGSPITGRGLTPDAPPGPHLQRLLRGWAPGRCGTRVGSVSGRC